MAQELCKVCGLRQVPDGVPEFNAIINPMSRAGDTSGRMQCNECGIITYASRIEVSRNLKGPFSDVTQALGLRHAQLANGALVLVGPQYLGDGREDPRTIVRRLQDGVGKVIYVGDHADPDARFTIDHVLEHGMQVIVHLKDRAGNLHAIVIPEEWDGAMALATTYDPKADMGREPRRVPPAVEAAPPSEMQRVLKLVKTEPAPAEDFGEDGTHGVPDVPA